MYLSTLISNHLKYKNFIQDVHFTSSNLYAIWYRLSVPAWCNDREFLKDDTRKVMYTASKKYNTSGLTLRKVDFEKTSTVAVSVGKNKRYCILKHYTLDELKDINLDTFVYNEYLYLFKEIKANIILGKIEDLSKQWDVLTSNKENVDVLCKGPFIHPTYNYKDGDFDDIGEGKVQKPIEF